MAIRGEIWDYATGVFVGIAMLLPTFSAGTALVVTNRYRFVLDALSNWYDIIRRPYERTPVILRGALIATGVITSIVLLAPLLAWLLSVAQTPITGFFAGLIIATALCFLPSSSQLQTMRWYPPAITAFGLATATHFIPYTVALTPYTAPLLAVVAVTAMLLPGVSGSYTLLVLGAYDAMLTAITNPFDNILMLTVFAITGAIYAQTIVTVLHRLITRYTDIANSAIFGVLLGGALVILLRTTVSVLVAFSVVVGTATYPLINRIQTNKS